MYILALDLSLSSDRVKWIWSERGLYQRVGAIRGWTLSEGLNHFNRSHILIARVDAIAWWTRSDKPDCGH